MIVEQKDKMSNGAIEQKKRISAKGLLILSGLWLAIFIAALTLIINLFQLQWQKIGINVQSLVNNKWQGENTAVNTESLTTKETITTDKEATKSSLETIDIDFIEGLVKAILTASESARVASTAAKLN